jgi:hypothetical protein
LAKYEISGGIRTSYRGSEEDWKPTKEFIEAWQKESSYYLPKCHLRIADVNYSTDEKVNGLRIAHYEFETYFGMIQYKNIGGGVVFTRENPDPWINNSQCLSVDMILPYNWFNPELKSIEPGYIHVQLTAPGTGLYVAEKLICYAHKLEYGYNRMIDTEYKGSRNELVTKNEDAIFSVTVSLCE